jgi:methanogenic corrinoid protein MtbC1
MSTAVESVARALSEWAVNRHAELSPHLAERYGPKWRREWVGAVRVCLQYLAQAMAVRQPELFAASMAWTRTAFDARAGVREDLRDSMIALREVVTDELPGPVADVAAEHIDRALEELGRDAGEPPSFIDHSSPHRDAVLRYLEAILEGRRDGAIDVIEQLVAAGVSVADICAGVLQPALAEIGRLWHLGEIAIADEHFGTSVTETIMSLLRRHYPKTERRGRRLLAASIGGELHAIGVRMVADFFEMDGWDVCLLGANTPEEALVDAVRTHQPDLLALSVISSLNVRAVGETIDRLKADPECSGVPILVGGPPFRLAPELWREIGADACAGSATESVAVGNELVTRPTSGV